VGVDGRLTSLFFSFFIAALWLAMDVKKKKWEKMLVWVGVRLDHSPPLSLEACSSFNILFYQLHS
jgi:hypothetical protein